MKILHRVWLAGWLLAASAAALAADALTVSHAWARATVPGQQVGAVYMNLQSADDTQLVKAESPAASVVEIHSMTMTDGVMEMRMLHSLPLPAGKVVKLEPGGLHLMLFDLKAPLRAGQEITVQLHVSRAGKKELVTVAVPVRPRQ
jgi:copper(I)-binding protein